MINKPVQELTAAELTGMWTEATQCDKSLFSEMRTNLQIVAGQHYLSEGSAFWNRIRDNKQLTEAQRIKLTKNHTQRVTTIYRNSIESLAPDVEIEAANQSELQDQKSAELNGAYWDYIKACEDFAARRAQWVKHFIEIGEVWVKIFWDKDGGQEVGYLPIEHIDETTGEKSYPTDEQGNYLPSDEPAYSGKIRFESLEGYNIKRDPNARTMMESPYLMVDKLIPTKSLRTLFKDEKLIRELETSKPNENMVIFDGNSRTYKTAENQVLVRECYWRPSPALRKGYFQFFTDRGILAQGELPYGVFPIQGENFEDQTGNPRGYSIIRPIRPCQVEINRCASKIAEHQITLGDDKAWIQANTKVNQGATLPGIRVNTYSGGQKPDITEGRSGEQYLPYLNAQIDELYSLANLQEIVKEQPDSPDLYTNLFRSFRFRRKFTVYGEKFERFLTRVCETALKIAKQSCHPDELIAAVGKSEYINIAEFKNSEELGYRIKIKPRSEDIETQFGKQITLNHIMQYVGQNLDKEDLGKMIRLSPFLNTEQMFNTLTNKYDSITNDILALDRGEFRPPRRYDDHKYIISSLSARMSKPDFEYLPSNVQKMYDLKIQVHERLEAEAIAEIEKAKAGFIPSGGYMVACDFYVPDPNNPQSSKRLRVPSESISWLVEKLRSQGSDLQQLEQMPQGVLKELAGMTNGQQSQPSLPMEPVNV